MKKTKAKETKIYEEDEYDTFWDDIYTNDYTNSHTIVIKESQMDSKYTPHKSIVQYSQKTQKLYNSLIDKYSDEKERIKREEKQAINEKIAEKRCAILYEHAKILHACHKEKRKENTLKAQQAELANCTFAPFNYHYYGLKKRCNSVSNTKSSDEGMYERNMKWLRIKEENNLKAKRKYNEKQDFSYQPELHLRTTEYMDTLFNEDKNVIYQPENQYYLKRQYDTRKPEPRDYYNQTIDIGYPTQQTEGGYKTRITQKHLKQFKTKMHEELLNLS